MTTPPATYSPTMGLFGEAQYLILQTVFWLLVGGLMCVAVVTGPPTAIMNEFDEKTRGIILEKVAELKPNMWLDTFLLPLTGLLLTHALHRISIRQGWADLPLRRLVQTAVIASLLLSGLGFIIVKAVSHLANRWWLHNHLPGSGFEYTLGDGSVPGFFVLCTWMVIYYSWQAFARLGQMELMQLRQEATIKDSRLDAITTQLNPHFLFNSLNTVRGLIEDSPAGARDAVTHLAHVLRVSLTSTRQRLVPMREELETVHAQLMLESARHGDRLTITSETDPAVTTARIPPLLLQTLIENAVKHGVGVHAGPGFVHYEAWMNPGVLKLIVRNSGTLADGWDLPGKGLGLLHTRERLALLFPGTASLVISSDGNVVTVETMIPQNDPTPSLLP